MPSSNLASVVAALVLAAGCGSGRGAAGSVDTDTDAQATMPSPVDGGSRSDSGGIGVVDLPDGDVGETGPLTKPDAAEADAATLDATKPDATKPDATTRDAGEHDAATFSGIWSPVSFGITTLDTGGGNNILIVYGGYTATDQDSQAWATQLTKVGLGQLGVGHIYAARGPEDPDYAAREIGNSELAAALATQADPATDVIIVAHSSGGFVADELFTFADTAVIAKIAYFNLDGGSWALTDDLVGSMRGVYFCNAHDSVAGDSENTSSDESLHDEFAASHFFTVDADGSGCDVGAGWCLHDTLIINHPHDPTTFDLALDYTDFTNGRQVVTSYIDQAVTDGVL
jgi:hypothetical protein